MCFSVKSDEKYLDVLPRLVRLLNVVGEEKERPSHIQEEALSLAGYKNSFADDKMSHIHAQESIVVHVLFIEGKIVKKNQIPIYNKIVCFLTFFCCIC